MIYYIVAFDQNDQKTYEEYLKPYFDGKHINPILMVDGNSIFEKYYTAINNLDIKDEDILCLIHQDIKIIDQYFEEKIQMVFDQKKDVGVLGIYGTKVFEEAGGWWLTDRKLNCHGKILQERPDLNEPFLMQDNPGYYDDLVSVDGCMMCIRGVTIKEVSFPINLYNGYHFYDVHFCLSAIEKKWRIAVADILIQHKSEGPLPVSWHENKNIFISHWKNKGYTFPITVVQFYK